jgi:omega-6 fatty acid desaturase (delta-12 desaturase)
MQSHGDTAVTSASQPQSPVDEVPSAASTTRRWGQALARYRSPNPARSGFELAITLIPLVLLWGAMWWTYGISYWLCLPLAVPAAGFLVRLFMIQHDCGHGSFFRQRMLNDWTGRMLGVLTLTPYDYWKHTHSVHHATFGNLERRGMGDITTLTVREYLAMSRWQRFGYRLYRHPIVMFGIGPAYLFLFQHRLPLGMMRAGITPWASTIATNAGIAAAVAIMIWFVGLGPFLMVHLPITLLGASIGVWLFYVQHQFEETSWVAASNWTLPHAALYGSSYYDLPQILRWFTANIGVHHVHHLSSKIPFYQLQRVMREHPELGGFRRLTLLESFRCVRLAVWDEARQKLVSFREADAQAQALPTFDRV